MCTTKTYAHSLEVYISKMATNMATKTLKYIYLSSQVSYLKTNEESIWIISRSRNRSLVVAIAGNCKLSIWRPIADLRAKIYLIVWESMLSAFLDCSFFKLLPLRGIHSV